MDKSDVEALRLCCILDLHGLTQNVNSATHKRRRTVDLVISRELSSIIGKLYTYMNTELNKLNEWFKAKRLC